MIVFVEDAVVTVFGGCESGLGFVVTKTEFGVGFAGFAGFVVPKTDFVGVVVFCTFVAPFFSSELVSKGCIGEDCSVGFAGREGWDSEIGVGVEEGVAALSHKQREA